MFRIGYTFWFYSFLWFQIEAHRGSVNHLAFSYPNEQLYVVTCGDDRLIKVCVSEFRLFMFCCHVNGWAWLTWTKTIQRSGMLLLGLHGLLLRVMKLLCSLFVLTKRKIFRYQELFLLLWLERTTSLIRLPWFICLSWHRVPLDYNCWLTDWM